MLVLPSHTSLLLPLGVPRPRLKLAYCAALATEGSLDGPVPCSGWAPELTPICHCYIMALHSQLYHWATAALTAACPDYSSSLLPPPPLLLLLLLLLLLPPPTSSPSPKKGYCIRQYRGACRLGVLYSYPSLLAAAAAPCCSLPLPATAPTSSHVYG